MNSRDSLMAFLINLQFATIVGTFLSLTAANAQGPIAPDVAAEPVEITLPPADWVPGEPYIDPWAGEEPMLVIDSTNVDQHVDDLPPGLVALTNTYPETFRIPVYPTHRTQAVPDWVAENIQSHAHSASLDDDGNGFTGARAGIPFPEPESGLEVYWNHIARWRGLSLEGRVNDVNVYPDGRYVTIGRESQVRFDYYLTDSSDPDRLFSLLTRTVSPARLAGGGALVLEPINQDEDARKAWTYDSGRRRVIRAPQLAYDSPLSAADGLRTVDETDLINGSPSRYEWKLIGHRELIVPHNNYRINAPDTDMDVLIMPGHINPEMTRYERHGVYVIEGTLRDEWRHIYTRRVLYVDENSWTALIAEMHGNDGELWRVSMNHVFNAYHLPAMLPAAYVFHDLDSRRYHVQGIWTGRSEPPETGNEVPDDGQFTPPGLRRYVR